MPIIQGPGHPPVMPKHPAPTRSITLHQEPAGDRVSFGRKRKLPFWRHPRFNGVFDQKSAIAMPAWQWPFGKRKIDTEADVVSMPVAATVEQATAPKPHASSGNTLHSGRPVSKAEAAIAFDVKKK